MSVPVIGVTTYGQDEKLHFTLPREYIDSIRRAGAIPFMIPPGESQIDHVLSMIDGIILAGGGDIDPKTYNGSMHESIYMLDEERDSSEARITKAVLGTDIPTLGICRGIQMLNTVMGGTLHEHVPDVYGETVAHRLPPREPVNHDIHAESSGRLYDIIQCEQFSAASWHHQSLKEVAPEFKVVARAPDGVIEAVEHTEHDWLLAVQWHPELTAANDERQQRLFDALVQVARERKQRRAN